WLWKIWMQRHSNQSSLPVIGDMQRECRAFDYVPILPDQEAPGLIRNQDAAVRHGRDGCRCIQIRGECVSNETWRELDSPGAGSESGKPSQCPNPNQFMYGLKAAQRVFRFEI